ncbi:undecaprenyldiphospho-muramoylpentapeptide beta-N-acetylglucosaminyltransferase [bacterium]
MKIAVAVSGTGGHIYPALSLADLLKKKKHEVVFIGSSNVLTRKLIEDRGFRLYHIAMKGWSGRKISLIFVLTLKNIISFFQSLILLYSIKPDIVIGMGGYISFPVILSAFILRKKIVIHEQNCYPGLANRMLGPFAGKVALGFKEASKYFSDKKTYVTGNPIREEFYNIDKEEAKKEFEVNYDSKTILIFGGSQGAHAVNILGLEVIQEINNRINNLSLIHITGEKDFEFLKEKYKDIDINAKVYEYYPDIYKAFSASDCIISRAGASTCAEILVTGRPAVIVPYPFAANNHQMKNARSLESLGIAFVYDQKELNVHAVSDKIIDILTSKELISSANNIAAAFKKQKAVDKLYELVINFR